MITSTLQSYDAVTLNIVDAVVAYDDLYADYGDCPVCINIVRSTFGRGEAYGSLVIGNTASLLIDASTIVYGSSGSLTNRATGTGCGIEIRNNSKLSPRDCIPLEDTGTDRYFRLLSGSTLDVQYWYCGSFGGGQNEVEIAGEGTQLTVSTYMMPLPSSSSAANYFVIADGALVRCDNDNELVAGSWYVCRYPDSNVNRIRFGGGYLAFAGDVRGTANGKLDYMLPRIGTVNDSGTATATLIQVREADGSWSDAQESDITITYCATAAESLTATGNRWSLPGYTILTGGAMI